MVGKTLDLNQIIEPDHKGCQIARKWVDWVMGRQVQEAGWRELRKYLFATDTTQTTNSKLPWKNKTTIPKLTQIRDNLNSNYGHIMFPEGKREWFDWRANNADDGSLAKREAILSYMQWVCSQPFFKSEMNKCISDYVDYGNTFATIDWVDQRVERPDKIQSGYVGPALRRISPYDIVFNPTASSFYESPKIVRSLITMGELQKKLEAMSTDANREEYKTLFKYMKDYRTRIRQSPAELTVQDEMYHIDGFDSFRRYIDSDFVEILTFYGDLYDWQTEELQQNAVIMVADRHKVISEKANPSTFGYPPIFHAGWRVRQDNLWAMGPLANLVGMQYKLDHIENLKADILDLIAFPVLKIKGYVNDFEWGPMQRIHTDGEGDVEMVAPPFQVLQMNNEVQYIMTLMEELSGSPREAMGFRTPGEKTAFEVSHQENAASRIFQSKTIQFSEQFVELALNGMLEEGRRNVQGPQQINVFDNDFKIQTFMTITADDISGAGVLKPVAARNFAEKAELMQNLSNMYATGMGQDPMVNMHISSFKMAKLLEDQLGLSDYGLVQKFVRIGEQTEAQRLQNAHDEQTQMQAGTPAGLTPDDMPGPDLMSSAGPQPQQEMPQ